MRDVQVRAGPIAGEAVRVLGPPGIQQARKEFVGGIIKGVPEGVVGIESEAESRTLDEIHGDRMVEAASEGRIGSHIAFESELGVNVRVEIVEGCVRGCAGGKRCGHVCSLEECG